MKSVSSYSNSKNVTTNLDEICHVLSLAVCRTTSKFLGLCIVSAHNTHKQKSTTNSELGGS